MCHPLLIVCLAVGFTNAVVEFSNSVMYDIYDFKGAEEVHLPTCDNGCLIFAATMGEGFEQYPDKLDPYAMNLIITDNDNDANTQPFAKLATLRDKDQRKTPLTITGKGNISVVNLNDPDEYFYNAVLLYVVDKTKAEEFSYEVFDVMYVNGKKITPQAEIVTFIGMWMFRIQAAASTKPNSITARLAGFDNALDTKDGCPYAYKSPDDAPFPGFVINSNPSIISFYVGKKNPIQFEIDFQYSSLPTIGTDGFIATPGWNGCTKPNKGGIQTFRTRNDLDTDTYIFMNYDEFNVTMDVLPNFDAKHKLLIQDSRNIALPSVVIGATEETYEYSNANNVAVLFQNMRGNQGFLLRYSSTFIPQTTTAETTTQAMTTTPKCIEAMTTTPVQNVEETSSIFSKTSPSSTVTESTTITSTVTSATTSSGFRATESRIPSPFLPHSILRPPHGVVNSPGMGCGTSILYCCGPEDEPFPLLELPNELILMILHRMRTADRLRARVNRRLYLLESIVWFHTAEMIVGSNWRVANQLLDCVFIDQDIQMKLDGPRAKYIAGLEKLSSNVLVQRLEVVCSSSEDEILFPSINRIRAEELCVSLRDINELDSIGDELLETYLDEWVRSRQVLTLAYFCELTGEDLLWIFNVFREDLTERTCILFIIIGLNMKIQCVALLENSEFCMWDSAMHIVKYNDDGTALSNRFDHGISIRDIRMSEDGIVRVPVIYH